MAPHCPIGFILQPRLERAQKEQAPLLPILPLSLSLSLSLSFCLFLGANTHCETVDAIFHCQHSDSLINAVIIILMNPLI